jgi:predicted dehydrogenase
VSGLRVGIAGAVRGGGFLAGLASLSGRAHLTAVYDPLPAAVGRFTADHPQALACTNFDDLLDHCDVVVLASPQQHHVPQAVMALGRGIHVLSEVPASVSLDQAKDLLAAVRHSDARYALPRTTATPDRT